MAFVLSIYPILYHVAFTLNMIEKLDTKISPLNLTLASCPGLWGIFKTSALLYYVFCVPVKFVLTHSWLVPHMSLVWSFSLRVLFTWVPCANLFVAGNKGTGLCPFLLGFWTFLLALAWAVSTHPRHTRCWSTETGLWLGQNLRPKEMDWETYIIKVSKRMGTVQKCSPLWWWP